jgi:tetratricopeptide (TPR) repeat protein
MKLLPKKEISKVKSVPLDPEKISNPQNATEYHQRGIAFYARKQYDLAVADFSQAISLDGSMVDAYYSLGMVLKASGRTADSVKAFSKVADLLAPQAGVGKAEVDMLRRLALGHINMLTQGDWNLEKEIWKHTD